MNQMYTSIRKTQWKTVVWILYIVVPILMAMHVLETALWSAKDIVVVVLAS